MKKVNKKKQSIEKIEEMALRGENVNGYFGGGKMMPPLPQQIQRVNVDFGLTVLRELDEIADELNVGRQAVIKLFIQREIDQHYLAKQARKVA